MSLHVIEYDLIYPADGTMVCLDLTNAPCHAVWDCDCEEMSDYRVEDGLPRHSVEDIDGEAHAHTGRFDLDVCNVCEWHANSDESVRGIVTVDVEPEWHGDHYTFRALTARVETGTKETA